MGLGDRVERHRCGRSPKLHHAIEGWLSPHWGQQRVRLDRHLRIRRRHWHYEFSHKNGNRRDGQRSVSAAPYRQRGDTGLGDRVERHRCARPHLHHVLEAGYLHIGDNNAYALTVTSAYDVGIGTMYPAAKMEIDTTGKDQKALRVTANGPAWARRSSCTTPLRAATPSKCTRRLAISALGLRRGCLDRHPRTQRRHWHEEYSRKNGNRHDWTRSVSAAPQWQWARLRRVNRAERPRCRWPSLSARL